MATFSTNQARQLYVAEALKPSNVISTDTVGSIAVKSDTAKNHLYFEYMGAGGMLRSDLIDIKNIMYAKATDADDLAHELAKYKVTLDPNVNGGSPVAGQDYILRIAFRNYIGMSEEDQYFKYGMVHAVSGMTAGSFYQELYKSLKKNFSRETEQLLDFSLEGTTTTDASGLIVEEVPQEWILGTFPQVPVNFTLMPDTIVVNGDDRIWGLVEKQASTNSIPDGHKIADLEYFCMGERGDVYRMMGFPNVIRTKYLVNPDLKYNTIDIHYAYVGSNEAVQKSEKDITIVVPKVGENNRASNKLTNDIISAINTATGLTITTLDVSA